jgi:ribonuclease T1
MLRSVKALVLFGLLLCLPLAAQASHHYARNDVVPTSVSETGLPSEARDTLRLIKQHGPFSFPRDGVVFSNYEHRLPQQPRGYYHEYTVKTPGARNRGARRIVCGPLPECYYSGDHYQTFQRIKE